MLAGLVLLGATGDLADRFLLPALAALQAAGRLPKDFALVGGAPQPWDEGRFREHVAGRLAEHAAGVPPEQRAALTRSLRYRRADAGDARDVAALVDMAGGRPVAAYLALPPGLFPVAVTALGAAGLPAGSRIALEKPFGVSLADARALNELLARTIPERAVFRVDHVLGMDTVRHLAALRRDPVLAAAWDTAHIERIEVRWEEDLALEGRASYYDGAGVLVDVLQNHILQLLCLLAMELPADTGEDALRDAKLAVLRAARATGRSRRARYGAGRVGGRAVPAYADEGGVDAGRGTETFAEVELALDTPRWRGTRVLLRAGKALRARRKEAVVRFRAPGGELRIGIDGPHDVALRLDATTLVGRPPASGLPAYARVLLDLLGGGSALAVGAEEAEEAWRVVEPVVAAWRDGLVPLEEYPAGSEGP